MKRKCVCFTTDLGYAFPSLLSAIQARQYTRADDADVVIIMFHAGAAAGDVVDMVCRDHGIGLIRADPQVLNGYTPMYARLFLDGLLPASYQRILYLDGDVQITGSLDDLMDSEFPDHAFLAAPDPMAILVDEAKPASRKFAQYFDSLNVRSSPASPYFNSGALLVNRGSWAEISAAALLFLEQKPGACLFQDQSALNAAGHRQMIPMSLRWNFPIFFRNCGVEQTIRPRLYHFMSKPKPWDAALPPWNRDFFEPYARLKRAYPGLATYARPMPKRLYLKYLAQQNVKRLQETLSWRLSGRRAAIFKFEAAARF